MTASAILLQGGTVYTPESVGQTDVLIINGTVAAIGPQLCIPSWLSGGAVIDARGALVIPGLIDQHVHITGGGGEGGPAFRTPEIGLSDLITAGITTVVGVLGTDGTGRDSKGLLAKARGLTAQGVSAWMYTGSYQVPTPTITGSARDDLVLIDRVLGIGEVAINDHRGSQTGADVLAVLASEARVGGLLAGKAGVLHLHVGEGKGGLNILFDIMERFDVPRPTFVPTHLNRTKALLKDAITWGQAGGYCDLTTGIEPSAQDALAVSAPDAARALYAANVDWRLISFSSDAQGSIPAFDKEGRLAGMDVGSAGSLFQAVLALHEQTGWSWTQCLMPVTTTPAEILGLPASGRLAPGLPADCVLLRDNTIDTVIAQGRIMMRGGAVEVRGMFEKVQPDAY